jgi:HK97 family phage prohead protease
VTSPLEHRLAPIAAAGNTLSGYAAKFGVLSQPLYGPRGTFVERIDPAAFTRSLKQTPDVQLLYNHEPGQLLARTTSGTLKLTPDKTGLAFEANLPDTTLGRDVRTLLERGDLGGQMSFGFAVRKDEWAGNTRTLLDVDLVEVSVVTNAAYPQTEAALRSAQTDARVSRVADRINRSLAICRLFFLPTS